MSNILNTTHDLIKIPSTSDKPQELQRIIKYAQDFFVSSPNLILHSYEQNGKPSLVVSTINTLTPDVLMIGHLDVVPADPTMFEPRIDNGRLIGRGACDMKSEDAVMMHILRTVAEEKNPPSMALMLTTDEEIGGMDGVNYLINKIGYRCKVALVPDGGELPEDIIIASKGAIHIRLTATGINAHGSIPWQGENAIEKLIDVYERVRKSFPATDSKEYWYTTCNLGTMNGGQATNQVPDHATCTLDIRHPESISRDEVIQRIREAAPECKLDVLVTGDASATAINDPYLQKYGELLQQMQNLKLKPCHNHAGHDGRFLTSHGIPVLISRPLSGEQHTNNEWVDLKSLENFYQLYLAFVKSFV